VNTTSFFRVLVLFEWPSIFYTLRTKIIPSTVVMIISRRLLSLGRKLCLFVYYRERINKKQWMVKKIVALNAGMWSRMVEGKDR
jgi:hypothetical protein